MWGVIFKAAVFVPIAVLLSLILDPFFSAAGDMIAAGPDAPLVLRAVTAVGDTFLLLFLLSLLVLIIGRAAVERSLVR